MGKSSSVSTTVKCAGCSNFEPLDNLFYCNGCGVRCMECCSLEIVCYYCPNCLFEVPSASVKAEQVRCGRNCFECPICFNSLIVQSSNDIISLRCTHCEYDSTPCTFERPTGLTTQLIKFIPQTLANTLTSVREHYIKEEKQFKTNPYHNSQPYSQLPIQEDNCAIDLESAKKFINIPSLESRLAQNSFHLYNTTQALPLRLPLRAKMSKRCRGCSQMLVKPGMYNQFHLNKDGKVSSLKFTTNEFTRKYIPRCDPIGFFIQLEKQISPSPLTLGLRGVYYLKVSNPYQDPIQIIITILETNQTLYDMTNQKVVLLGGKPDGYDVQPQRKVVLNTLFEKQDFFCFAVSRSIGHIGIPIEIINEESIFIKFEMGYLDVNGEMIHSVDCLIQSQ